MQGHFNCDLLLVQPMYMFIYSTYNDNKFNGQYVGNSVLYILLYLPDFSMENIANGLRISSTLSSKRWLGNDFGKCCGLNLWTYKNMRCDSDSKLICKTLHGNHWL